VLVEVKRIVNEEMQIYSLGIWKFKGNGARIMISR
jgi:hypothetical protein